MAVDSIKHTVHMASVKLLREGEEEFEDPVQIKLTQLTPLAVCTLFSVSQ